MKPAKLIPEAVVRILCVSWLSPRLWAGARLVTALLGAALAGVTAYAAADGPFAYIPNYQGNSVSVVDTSTNQVVKTISDSLPPRPAGVAVNPSGSRAYIAHIGDWYGSGYNGDSVSVIDTGTNTVIATVNGMKGPLSAAVSPDGNRVYVTNFGDIYQNSSLSVIDANNNTVVAVVPLGLTPYGVVVSPDGKRVYVSNEWSHTVSAIDTSTYAVTTIGTAQYPSGLAINPAGTKLYVAHYYDHTVTVIDTATNTVTTSIPVYGGGAGITMSPDGTRVYSVCSYYGIDGRITVIDTATDSVLTWIDTGYRWPAGMSVTPDGRTLYAASQADNKLVAINTATNSVAAAIDVGAYPIAFGQFIKPASTAPADTTPPVIQPVLSGIQGSNGWYRSDVSVTWSITDPESSITTRSAGCTPTTISSDTAGATLTCTATSAGGTASRSVTIKRDATPPAIAGLSASPGVLWPPNHNMVNVTVAANATDALTPPPSCAITAATSNEPDNGLGDGDTAGDIGAPNVLGIRLRAERAGNGTGRIYTLTVQCTDAAGNSATRATTVTVPRSQGK